MKPTVTDITHLNPGVIFNNLQFNGWRITGEGKADFGGYSWRATLFERNGGEHVVVESRLTTPIGPQSALYATLRTHENILSIFNF